MNDSKVPKLALHWQILIGMVTGGVIGVLLNLNAREYTVTLDGVEAGSYTRVELQDVNSMVLISAFAGSEKVSSFV